MIITNQNLDGTLTILLDTVEFGRIPLRVHPDDSPKAPFVVVGCNGRFFVDPETGHCLPGDVSPEQTQALADAAARDAQAIADLNAAKGTADPAATLEAMKAQRQTGDAAVVAPAVPLG